jgi:hypothetical protein
VNLSREQTARAIASARNRVTDHPATPPIAESLRPQREKLSGSFREFVKTFWPVIEPKRPLVWGWHIDCLFEHMNAVLKGEIRILLINIAPGHFKSSSWEFCSIPGRGHNAQR